MFWLARWARCLASGLVSDRSQLFFLSKLYVCSKKSDSVVFELVQSGKLSVKASCGLRFCLTPLSVSCWLNQFSFEINWFKYPHEPPALV